LKLLFDENLSRRLVSRLSRLYPGCTHAANVGLIQSPDRQVWEFAKANGMAIVSADADFYELATTMGPPPKVIWLRRWTHTTTDAEDLLRHNAVRISEFERDPGLAVLILDKRVANVKKPVPEFRSEDQERAFWAAEDSTEYAGRGMPRPYIGFGTGRSIRRSTASRG